MKKSIYIGIAVIIIILMIIAIGIFAFTGKNKKETTTNANTVLQNEQKQNEVIEKQVNEVITNEIENMIENIVTNETSQNIVENITSSEILEESPKTAEEKAIEIAKKDWKETSDAEFLVEGMDDNGNYIVVVRNSQTTEALAFYSINITSQTFTKREMN